MRKNVSFITALLFSSALGAQTTFVDYYGVVSQSSDTNILKMAQDVFYTQLSAISSVTVDDKRADTTSTLTAIPDFTSSAKNHIVFYAEIEEKLSDNTKSWLCTFKATVPLENKKVFKTEEYQSYYKILASAKNTIEEILNQFNPEEKDNAFITEDKAESNVNSDAIAGIWQGEPFTDKIVLMRSGKGFVIFKNGASMNVRISISESSSGKEITITQDGKPNASFYPSLPRELAAQYASTADPISWKMNLLNPNTLSGTKNTLVQSNQSVIPGKESVKWIKK